MWEYTRVVVAVSVCPKNRPEDGCQAVAVLIIMLPLCRVAMRRNLLEIRTEAVKTPHQPRTYPDGADALNYGKNKVIAFLFLPPTFASSRYFNCEIPAKFMQGLTG